MSKRSGSSFANGFLLVFNQASFHERKGLLSERKVRRAQLAEKKYGDLSIRDLWRLQQHARACKRGLTSAQLQLASHRGPHDAAAIFEHG